MIEFNLARRMRIPFVAISDIHAGAGDAADNHARNRDALIRFVAEIPRDWLLVGIGDLFELWESSARAVAEHNQLLIRILWQRGEQFRYLIGNHDRALDVLRDLGPFRTRHQSPDGWFAEHGHFCDPWNRPGTWSGRIVTALNAVAERAGLRPAATLARFLESRFAKHWGLARFGAQDPTLYLQRAATFFRRTARRAADGSGRLELGNIHLYLWGHTHEAGIWTAQDIRLATGLEIPEGALAVNTGCWIDEHRDITVAAGARLWQGRVADWPAILAAARRELAVAEAPCRPTVIELTGFHAHDS